METIRRFASHQEAQKETGEGIEMLYSSEANVRARLVAPSLVRVAEKKPFIEFDKGLTVFFYDDSLRQSSKLTADYGRIDEHSNNMVVRNNVEVVNTKNETLQTEELLWNNQTRRITTDKFVKIKTQKEILYGDGLDANEDMTYYKIKKIRGTIQLDESF